MGYNTTIVVYNDALNAIKEDKSFGESLYNAAIMVESRGPQDIPSGNHANAARVIETHHADRLVAVVVGGNDGEPLGHAGPWPLMRDEEGNKERMLKNLADEMGYRLVKKARK